jgi:hypothetical protein
LSVAFADIADGHGRGGNGCRTTSYCFSVDFRPYVCEGTVHVSFGSIHLEWRRDLHNRRELLNDCSVRVLDTQCTAEVLAESAVVDEIVVLILVADIFAFLALEQSAEPAQNDIG